MQNGLVLIGLTISWTNEELIAQMRLLKEKREHGWEHILCYVGGFDDDQRKLWDIPEVRAFCRRLSNIGFISYLDYISSTDEKLRQAWGAAEVWACAEGRMKEMIGDWLSKQFLSELMAAVCESNSKADAACGPMK